jgi:formiminotetrahydrofolate cyclodeaminase
MRSYSARSLGDVLDAFSSNEPVPGGGSASALTGAIGVALLMMVAGLPRTRTGSNEERTEMDEASARLRPHRVALAQLIDRDSQAYSAVVDAFRMPKITADEQAVRRRAIDAAMHGATETPLEILRVCQKALTETPLLARHVAKSAASDVGVAIELLCAAARGSGMNVETNLGSIRDAEFADRMRTERGRLEDLSLADADRARELLSS